MNKILILENSANLEDAYYVNNFLEKYEGEQIVFTLLHTRKKEDIFKAVNECTDIITQTCFINGSDDQFYQFLELLSNIKQQKNIYIALLGNSLLEWFEQLTPEQILKIKQHNIYEIIDFNNSINKLSFAYITIPFLRNLVKERQYKRKAVNRTTGKKCKILACNAHGKAFENIKIGEIVDILDMSELEPNSNRGIWIQGNGEPIKLVNDCGLKEYEIVTQLDTLELLEEIYKSLGLKFSTITRLQLFGLEAILNIKDLDNLSKANILCEELNVEKRHNRSLIYEILNNNEKL